MMIGRSIFCRTFDAMNHLTHCIVHQLIHQSIIFDANIHLRFSVYDTNQIEAKRHDDVKLHILEFYMTIVKNLDFLIRSNKQKDLRRDTSKCLLCYAVVGSLIFFFASL